jgi:hypothetical protein
MVDVTTAETHLLQQVSSQHEDLGVRAEALHGPQVSNALLVVLGGGHDLKDVEGGPRHVVSEHLQVDELEEGRCFEVWGEVAHASALGELLRSREAKAEKDQPIS